MRPNHIPLTNTAYLRKQPCVMFWAATLRIWSGTNDELCTCSFAVTVVDNLASRMSSITNMTIRQENSLDTNHKGDPILRYVVLFHVGLRHDRYLLGLLQSSRDLIEFICGNSRDHGFIS
jgi:hypothetical protein